MDHVDVDVDVDVGGVYLCVGDELCIEGKKERNEIKRCLKLMQRWIYIFSCIQEWN